MSMSVSEISPSEDTFHEAIRLMNEEQEDKALELVNQLLKAQPENVPALHAKACLLADLEKNEEAIRICEKIQKIVDPNTYSNEEYGIPCGFVHMIASRSHLGLENDEEAMEHIQTAIKINEIAPYLFVRAMVHIERSDFKDAAKDIVFVISYPYEGKTMDNSAEEISELFKAISSGVQEALEELGQASIEKPVHDLRNPG